MIVCTDLYMAAVMHHVLHVLLAACRHDWCNYFYSFHPWGWGLDLFLLFFVPSRGHFSMLGSSAGRAGMEPNTEFLYIETD